MQDVGYGLPRTPLLGRWVNKGKKKGRGRCCQGPEGMVAEGRGPSRTPTR